MPVEAALQTGFSDQSHFTRFFTMFTGVAPGAYGDIFEEHGNGLTREQITDPGSAECASGKEEAAEADTNRTAGPESADSGTGLTGEETHEG